MSSLLIKVVGKSMQQEDHLLEPVIMMLQDHKLDSYNVQKEKSKKGRKWFILSLSMKQMSSIVDNKASQLYLQETLVKSNRKSESRLIRKQENGEKKEKLIQFQEYYSLMKSICQILSVSLSSIEHWKMKLLLL